MLHNIALATNNQTPSFQKEAIPSAAQHAAMAAADKRRLIDMLHARGVEIPLVEKPIYDASSPKGYKMQMVPDLENVRANPQGAATTQTAEIKTPKTRFEKIEGGKPIIDPISGKQTGTRGGTAKGIGIAAGGKPILVEHRVPGPSIRAEGLAGGPLAEKGIQEAHGTVSNSPVKKLRHKTLGGAKRFWGGQNAFGGKWRNRLALAGGVAALGAGVNTYLKSNKAPQPTMQPEGGQYPTEAYSQPQQHSPYGKYGADYSPNAALPPKPPAFPTVPSPGPGIGGVPTIKPPSFGASLKPPKSPTSSISGPSLGGSTKKADTVSEPLAGAALGGIGGWALGNQVISPMMDTKAQKLMKEIAEKQKMLKRVQSVKRMAPTGAALAGALLLAALAAIKARQDERENLARFRENPYNQTQSGFQQNEQVPMGTTHPEMFYG